MPDESRSRDDVLADLRHLQKQFEEFRDATAGPTGEQMALARFFENLHDTYYRADSEGNLALVSDNCEQALGYAAGEALGRNLAEEFFSVPEDVERFSSLMESSGRVKDFETRLKKRDGSVVSVLINASRFSEAGDGAGTHGIIRDVSERRKVEADLERSEQYYSLFAENVTDVVWSMSLDGKFTFLSSSIKRSLGYEPSELIGKGLETILTPESHKRVVAVLRERIPEITLDTGDGATLELEHIHKDGSRGWAEVRANLLRDKGGRPTSIIGVTRDISERKKAEDAVRQSEEWYRSLIELGATVYAVVDAEARIKYGSPSAERQFGWIPDELMGSSIFELVHPDDRSATEATFRSLALNPGSSDTATVRCRHSDGHWMDVEVSGTNLLGNSTIGGIVLAAHDVSDRKRAEDALEKREGQIVELEHEVAALRSEVKGRYEFGNIVGRDPKMLRIYETVLAVSKTLATVLILGETGTGKELIAKAIHYNSPRAEGPFIKVDCGALVGNLLESELFGHVKGAYTGAVRDRPGRFELASGGTIFLDEIQNLSMALQAKLLRVLQDGSFERVGSSEVREAEVRVIAATNTDLLTQVDEEKFRKDLYYRLSVIPIQLPALREKPGDISLLVADFVKRFAERHKKQVRGVTPAALDALLAHDWPGNVRELENAVEHAVVFCRGSEIDAGDIRIQRSRSTAAAALAGSSGSKGALRDALEVPEKQLILNALERSSGNRKKAAELLGIGRTAFYNKLKRHGIPVKSRGS